jgi:hypothetical protein
MRGMILLGDHFGVAVHLPGYRCPYRSRVVVMLAWPYDEYDAFADDKGVDDRLRADVADALGEKYVEELDI